MTSEIDARLHSLRAHAPQHILKFQLGISTILHFMTDALLGLFKNLFAPLSLGPAYDKELPPPVVSVLGMHALHAQAQGSGQHVVVFVTYVVRSAFYN